MKYSLLFVILLFSLSAACQNIISMSNDTIFVTIKEPTIKDSMSTHENTKHTFTHSMIVVDHGYFVNGQKFSKREVEDLIKNNDVEAYQKWKTAYGFEIFSSGCLGGSLGIVLGCLISKSKQTGWYIAGGVLGGLGLITGICSGVSYSKAIKIYNSHVPSSTAQLDFQISPNGIGLAYKF